MTGPSKKPVAVGVDGTPISDWGVRYAALEARRLDVSLAIVHTTLGYAAGPHPPIVPYATLRDYGLQLLENAADVAREAVPDLEIETSLLTEGSTVASLAAYTRQARLLVLGAERRSFAGRLWTGDVVAGVAGQAECPVVVVPPEWRPTDAHGRIVVAIKSPERMEGMVAAGLALAYEHGAELTVMHAWKLPSGYDDVIADRIGREGFALEQTSLIEPLVKAARDRYPDVPVHIQIVHEQPAAALVRASLHADRLLISRPRHGGYYHRIGGVARAVLHDARCPVQVHAPDEVV